ncbi:hypothetical protein SAMN05660649_00170 [Desulfotomaculum arcticum]|uniref:Flagellar Assembly Protein A N-terminal region domain-containing protein n=1 Tax=Desulfotruncus arcticus DSM 17038 TaxID=1121424 RepID=A0A1I2MWF5_9FIRM|nr:hypothetical protein SAMN05660649_00170 [Desulfotomaculum arcticum] [Desulfotruncus arcticus DSM 17038]
MIVKILRGDILNNDNTTLVITEDKLKALLTIREKGDFDPEVIKHLLNEKGIKHGIDQAMLQQIAQNPKPGSYLIASGTPPKEGRDGYMQYLFSSGASKESKASLAGEKKMDEKNIDFREIFNVPSVSAKTELAIYHPMVKGEDGVTVTGQAIPARKVFELALRAGKNAKISDDDKNIIVSTASGRPWVKKAGRNVTVGIEAVYQHEGDVDIKSGNLRFNGDVIINGNVNDNMIVDVAGNLRIWGFVSRSNINVSGKLEVMKVITASKVNVGGVSANLDEVDKRLQEIKETILKLEKTARQFLTTLRENKKTVQYGQIIMALSDKKFPHMKKQLDGLMELVNKNKQSLPEEVKNAAAALNQLCGIKALEVTGLDNIKESLETAIKFLNVTDNGPSDIIANSIWNSEIAATGSVKLLGQGTFNSRLVALNSVEIKGVARGGEIISRGNVIINEIGAPMGVKTLVRTDKEGIIKAKLLYNGSVLQIGKRILTAREDYSMVVARLTDDNEISLY